MTGAIEHRPSIVNGKDGMALLLALGVMLAMTILASALLMGFHRSMEQTVDRERELQCMNLAEAGIAKALVELRAGDGSYRGEANTPLGDGDFTVVVTPLGLQRFAVESTGTLNHHSDIQARVVVDAEVLGGEPVRVLRWEESFP
jgi:hypothetical protein